MYEFATSERGYILNKSVRDLLSDIANINTVGFMVWDDKIFKLTVQRIG